MSQPLPVFEFDRVDIQTSYCIDLDTRDRQVMENSRRILHRLKAHQDREGEIAVVCYGPSLEDTWEQVKNFQNIITVSGAHKFLIDRGIIPTWHAEVDPRPHKADLIGKPHKDVEYLCASVCHPAVFDLLEGCNVKLWHVFAHEAGREKVPQPYPHGEWCITGGSNVGLRAMVLARFLGFKRMTVFGMDYSFKVDGTQHAGWHPKENPSIYAVHVNGETFFTNPPMHQYAQQFFDEVAKLGDIQIEVAGHGLLQAQIKEHLKTKPLIPTQTEPSLIAAMLPNVITPEYSALNRQLHEQDPNYGTSGSKRAEVVRKLIEKTKPATVLDYGCGKGTLAAALPFPIWEYDPAIPGKDSPPRCAELVVCTDVLEHIEPECLDSVLLDLSRVTMKVAYVVIHTGAAIKVLPDGRNTHLIQESMEWWKTRLEQFFRVANIAQDGVEITAILGPKPKEATAVAAPSLDYSKRITPVRHDGTEARFYTPNDQTQWRAKTLFTKEPVTIEWIDTFKPGEVFFDVGANVGGYSVWASKRRGVKVYAFEPESGNYALLCRNFALNDVDGLAYCCAINDENKMSAINLSSREVGGGCHTFDSDKWSIKQGCFGWELDDLIKTIGQPDHIKIDVDGLEHRVIYGGETAITNCKSVLIEINPNIPEHKDILKTMYHLGFHFDPAQVEKSTRKEGQFKGVAEYVFRRKQPCIVNLPNDRIAGAFPYLFMENVFPDDIYQRMIASLPSEYTPIENSRNVKGYPERFTANPTDAFWTDLFWRMRDGELKRRLCVMFGVSNPNELTDECLLIRDLPGYAIGPHTDSPKKVITALFYLPKDNSASHAGTSIYKPKEEGFTCKGGPHYGFDKFTKVGTMPFIPNSAFFFRKTDTSFHGVEPCDVVRDVLLYDIRRA